MSVKDIDDEKYSIQNLEKDRDCVLAKQEQARKSGVAQEKGLAKTLKCIQVDLKERKELVKSVAMSMERENYNHLIFIASGNNFHKIAGHSLVFYSSQIAARIGRRYNIKNDTDFYFKSDTGIISIELTDDIINKLKNIQISPNKTLSKPDILVFDLPWTFSNDDVKRLQEESHIVNDQINSLVIPKNSIPALYDDLRSLNRIIYYNCTHMEQLARNTIGVDLFNTSKTMMLHYVELANDDKITKENLLKIRKGALYIKDHMKTVEELRLMNQKDIKEILERAIEISVTAARKYNQELKNEAAKSGN